jgi:phosphate transport system permease protein
LYVAEFASERQRTIIKSTVELLAGIPTVVVGFVAFVTLSTAINVYYTAHQAYFDNGQWIVFPIQLAVLAALGSAIGGSVALRRWPHWQKFAGYAGAVAAGIVCAFILGRVLEAALGGSLRGIFGVTKLTQLNGLLAGVCLGFAIIPVIFSVAEDAMRAVPQSQREASLALGGSKWETALRVVVPAAFPGIYAAVTLGMARAIGETMIVLMASGNTALPDWSPFTGMRTMAAAIAIEAPEKALGSTGYYVLFFVGALLFLLCFLLNAAADQVIYRLKRRYRLN